MKKLMIGILVIIPIVVLLVVGLVTSFVSVNAFIGVESVELDKHSLTLELGKTYALDGEGGLFNVTVLPELARDRTYEWTIDNIRSHDAEFPDEDGERIIAEITLDENAEIEDLYYTCRTGGLCIHLAAMMYDMEERKTVFFSGCMPR